jgi:hypothetical protein
MIQGSAFQLISINDNKADARAILRLLPLVLICPWHGI